MVWALTTVPWVHPNPGFYPSNTIFWPLYKSRHPKCTAGTYISKIGWNWFFAQNLRFWLELGFESLLDPPVFIWDVVLQYNLAKSCEIGTKKPKYEHTGDHSKNDRAPEMARAPFWPRVRMVKFEIWDGRCALTIWHKCLIFKICGKHLPGCVYHRVHGNSYHSFLFMSTNTPLHGEKIQKISILAIFAICC